MKQVHALYVGLNYRYLSPTPSLIPALVTRACTRVHFYGPGFVSPEVLVRGVEAYVDSIGGVDIIFASKDFASGYPLERFGRFLRKYAIMMNGGTLNREILLDVRRFLERNRDRVVCFLTDLDPHAVPQVDLDNFKRHALYFVMWGKQFLNTLGDARWAAVEGHLQKKLKMGHTLGLLDGFAEEQSSRIINLSSFVSESEFHWGGLANRPYDVAVPGSAYARRQHFLKALAMSGRKMPNFNYRYFYKVADRTPIRPYSRFILVNLYNLFFQRALSQTKMCVTDGGANNYPVRKFFEIAAAGSVLACPPASGMDALGFRDNVHYIAVRDADEAVQAARAVHSDLERYEAIADAGRTLVYEKHTLGGRAVQLEAAVLRIMDGTFEGSYWKDGQFICA